MKEENIIQNVEKVCRICLEVRENMQSLQNKVDTNNMDRPNMLERNIVTIADLLTKLTIEHVNKPYVNVCI